METLDREGCGYFVRDDGDALLACQEPASVRYVKRDAESVIEYRCDAHDDMRRDVWRREELSG